MDDRSAIENFLLTGAEEAFCELFEAVYPRVRRYFLLRGIEAGEAEDLAQNVMVIVYRRAGEVREQELFYGWLFKVAKNELAQFWRRRQTRIRTTASSPTSGLTGHHRSSRNNAGDGKRAGRTWRRSVRERPPTVHERS